MFADAELISVDLWSTFRLPQANLATVGNLAQLKIVFRVKYDYLEKYRPWKTAGGLIFTAFFRAYIPLSGEEDLCNNPIAWEAKGTAARAFAYEQEYSVLFHRGF